MKEKISERNKKPYVYLLIISVLSVLIWMPYLNTPIMKYMSIILIALMSLASVIWVYLLVDPRGVIERCDNTLILRRGLNKTVIGIDDILGVSLTQDANKNGQYQKNSITLKVLVNGTEKNLICSDVVDEKAVVGKIAKLINNSNKN